MPDPIAVPRHRPPRLGRADLRVLRGVLAAAVQPYRPLMGNLIVTRRCNLSCGYCHEYDKVSPPVPLQTLRERIDHLARLRTVMVTLTGGETLLHPDVVAIVAYIKARGMTPVMNTNGYLLTAAMIRALGAAGLYAMQLSLDNVHPNDVSKKSLRPLRPKLRLLAAHARFRVRVNTVFGAGPPEEALEVVRAMVAYGFDAKCSLARDATGKPLPLDAHARAVYDQIQALGGRRHYFFREDFQADLLDDGALDWRCRAGARFFHVCEDGLVHLCAPKVGAGGTPLAQYGEDDLRRAFHTPKPCTATCPISYAHQASQLDRFRRQDAARGDTRLLSPAPDGRVHLPVLAA